MGARRHRLHVPAGVGLLLASCTASRYFIFPIQKWGFDWWQKTFDSMEVRQLFETSLIIALFVTVIAVVIALFGALAFARYEWKGRSLYQKIVLLPIFFPQTVLGLALLLWFNALGFTCHGRPPCSRIWSGSSRSDAGHFDPGLFASIRPWRRQPSISAPRAGRCFAR